MRLIQHVHSLPCLVVAFCLSAVAGIPASAAQTETLDNGAVTATFEDGALVRLRNTASNRVLELSGDSAAITVNAEKFAAPGRKLIATERRPDGIAFKYEAGDKQFQIVYELKPGWQFVSKQIRLTLPADGTCRVEAAEVLRANVKTPIAREHKASNGSGAVFLRLGDANSPPKYGVFLAMQNPFLKWERKDGQLALAYSPDMEWRAAYGPFESDRVCLGLYELTGVEFPARNLREWQYVREPERAFANHPAAGHGRVRRRDAVRGRLRAVPPAEESARSRAVVRKRLPDRRGQTRGPCGMETHPGSVRRGRCRTLAVHARQ